ncbi:MAG: flagellar hook-length control protein FliK [Candidatus Accumulibacter sp.]|nr:flagellar hook-length control protein FliK [Accumulibacter sp.]
MSITIVASFLKPPAPATTAEGIAAGSALADGSGGGLDFASVLLGLPPKASVVPATEETPPASTTAAGEADPPLGEAQFLTVLDLRQVNTPIAPTAQSPLEPRLAGEGEFARVSRIAGKAPAVTSATATTPTPTADPKPGLVIDDGSAASTAVGGDGKAANFAVAAVAAAQTSGRVDPKVVEAAPPSSNLATLAATPHAQTATAVPADLASSLHTPLRDPSWAGDFGQKLLWFASNDKQFAQMTLNPPQLGSLEVTLKLDKDGANAHFFSANADVRGAIENALPRLREMFSTAGIELAQVSVGSESSRQPGGGQHPPAQPPHPLGDGSILAIDSVGGFSGHEVAMAGGSALIDIFA